MLSGLDGSFLGLFVGLAVIGAFSFWFKNMSTIWQRDKEADFERVCGSAKGWSNEDWDNGSPTSSKGPFNGVYVFDLVADLKQQAGGSISAGGMFSGPSLDTKYAT